MDYEPYHHVERKRTVPFEYGYNAMTLEWLNPNAIYEDIVSLKRKFAQNFLTKGTIKFSTPASWVEYAFNNATGRGDILEGSYAAYPYDSNVRKFILENQNPDSDVVPILYKNSNLLHLKHRESMQLPCYCFYMFKLKQFTIQRNRGKLEAKATIPARYFRGLEDGRNWLTENELDKGEQLVSVIVENHEEFIKRIKSALNEIGVSNNEIIIRPIKYYELDKPYCKRRQHPMELFVKDKQFEDQSEGRIVIHTKNKEAERYLRENTIDIGSIEDIAYLDDHYYSGGMFVTMDMQNEYAEIEY